MSVLSIELGSQSVVDLHLQVDRGGTADGCNCEELQCGTLEWGTGTKVAFSFQLGLSVLVLPLPRERKVVWAVFTKR